MYPENNTNGIENMYENVTICIILDLVSDGTTLEVSSWEKYSIPSKLKEIAMAKIVARI